MAVDNKTFVQDVYTVVLLRPGSDADVNTWAGLITNGLFTRAGVEAAILASAEAQNFVDPIVRLYQGFFDRAPDAAGLQGWIDILRNGTMTLTQIAEGFSH